MSELICKYPSRNPRRHLLATVSISAIIGLGGFDPASADERTWDRPTVWIELGGQLEHLGKQAEAYIPPFAELASQNGLISPASVQRPSNYAFGEEGRISFQPAASEWTFSAAVRYGRSSTKKHKHQQMDVPGVYFSGLYYHSPTTVLPYGPNNRPIPRTADYTAKSGESHAVLDFLAGKDVGLGVLPRGGSHLDFGVRIAQFTSRSILSLLADPDPHVGFKYFPPAHRSAPLLRYFQFDKAEPDIARSFNGLGPSLAWSGSVPVMAATDGDAELTLDFGANVSVLFGRQKARIHHHTTGDSVKVNPFKYPDGNHSTYINDTETTRVRSVVIPNVGGIAGVSLKLPNAKVSLGYRADFFFGAMDGGLDTRKTKDEKFYGPFATISFGL